MTSIADQKSELRKSVLLTRDELQQSKRVEMSLEACEIGLRTQELAQQNLQGGTVVSGFFPIRSEIDPRPLMSALAQRGARLCVPVVTSKTTIIFRELVPGAKLENTGFGTIGPTAEAAELDPNIMLVPLSAFDARGARMGYGAGHYDRAIERLVGKGQTPTLLGMGFSIQQLDTVPTEPHDRFLDGIITNKKFISPPPKHTT